MTEEHAKDKIHKPIDKDIEKIINGELESATRHRISAQEQNPELTAGRDVGSVSHYSGQKSPTIQK